MFVFIPFIILINLQTTFDSYINSEKQISEINDIMHVDKNSIESTGIESLSVDEIAAIDHLENSGMVNEYILKYINTRFGREVGKLISKVVRICRYIYHLS